MKELRRKLGPQYKHYILFYLAFVDQICCDKRALKYLQILILPTDDTRAKLQKKNNFSILLNIKSILQCQKRKNQTSAYKLIQFIQSSASASHIFVRHVCYQSTVLHNKMPFANVRTCVIFVSAFLSSWDTTQKEMTRHYPQICNFVLSQSEINILSYSRSSSPISCGYTLTYAYRTVWFDI